MMSQTYKIDGMHCQACVAKIDGTLQGLAEKVEVTLNPPQVVLFGEKIADTEALNQALAGVGNYHIAPTVPLAAPQSWLSTYYPLFLILAFICVVSLKGIANWHDWMLHFMAGFFIVFSFFKLLDLNGFKDAYSTYDLLARRWANYGLIYPFLELGLGLAFLFEFKLAIMLWLSMGLMAYSSLGVIKALSEKRKIRCACLGTVLNLPMSTITLVEDLGMVVMSGLMLIYA